MSGKIHVFTARLSADQYELLKAYAYLARVPINDIVVEAIETFLRTHINDAELDAMVERLREALRREP